MTVQRVGDIRQNFKEIRMIPPNNDAKDQLQDLEEKNLSG